MRTTNTQTMPQFDKWPTGIQLAKICNMTKEDICEFFLKHQNEIQVHCWENSVIKWKRDAWHLHPELFEIIISNIKKEYLWYEWDWRSKLGNEKSGLNTHDNKRDRFKNWDLAKHQWQFMRASEEESDDIDHAKYLLDHQEDYY